VRGRALLRLAFSEYQHKNIGVTEILNIGMKEGRSNREGEVAILRRFTLDDDIVFVMMQLSDIDDAVPLTSWIARSKCLNCLAGKEIKIGLSGVLLGVEVYNKG